MNDNESDTNEPYSMDKIRNPERIDPLCYVLADYWKEHPDWRFGQLVYNLYREHDQFNAEDTVLMDELDVAWSGEYWVDEDE